MDLSAGFRLIVIGTRLRRSSRAMMCASCMDRVVGRRLFGMEYLKFRRSRIILAAFALFSILFVAFPGIDLYVSRLFFHGGFPRDQWWQTLLHDALNGFLCL